LASNLGLGNKLASTDFKRIGYHKV
jgi:hypothetical protein